MASTSVKTVRLKLSTKFRKKFYHFPATEGVGVYTDGEVFLENQKLSKEVVEEFLLLPLELIYAMSNMSEV